MSLPARFAWVLVALVLMAGGIAFVSLDGARSGAQEQLARAVAEEARVEGEAERQSERIEDLVLETSGEQREREACLVEMLEQTREWNKLLEDMPTLFYSTSEIQSYADRAMGLVDEARTAELVCSKV